MVLLVISMKRDHASPEKKKMFPSETLIRNTVLALMIGDIHLECVNIVLIKLTIPAWCKFDHELCKDVLSNIQNLQEFQPKCHREGSRPYITASLGWTMLVMAIVPHS